MPSVTRSGGWEERKGERSSESAVDELHHGAN
jgi:hypothetical protein